MATAQRAYESDRDLLDYVESLVIDSPSNVTVCKYDYTLDTLGRRTAGAMTGYAVAKVVDHHWDFGYNNRNVRTG